MSAAAFAAARKASAWKPAAVYRRAAAKYAKGNNIVGRLSSLNKLSIMLTNARRPGNMTFGWIVATLGLSMWVLVGLLLVGGYFVWDGFVPRNLTAEDLRSTKLAANMVNSGWVEYQHYPIQANTKYLAIYIDNQSEYILREIRIGGYFFDEERNVLGNFLALPCQSRGITNLRIVKNTPTSQQACVVQFPREQQKIIESPRYHSFEWHTARVRGHSMPIKFLYDLQQWIIEFGIKFEKVNK